MIKLIDVENKNCTCNKTECNQYKKCNGDTFCICTEVIEPYIQEHEVLAPVFIPVAFGTDRFYRSIIGRDVYKKKGKAYIHLNRALRVNDIISLTNRKVTKYYLKRKLHRKDFFNNFVYEIKRVDNIPLTYIDLQYLITKKEVVVLGYYSENNT